MVHKFINNDIKIAFDVESGTVLELDDLSYELLGEEGLKSNQDLSQELIKNYSIDEIEEARAELSELINEGYLYSKELEELPDVRENFQVKALCLHVAHDCNLRCRYCFAGQGDFNGERSLMNLDTAKAAIDFVIKSSGNRHNIEVDFFGGEPLMNFEVVKKTVEYARSLEEKYYKHFKFTLTTNGVLLNDSNMDWIDENMDNVVLSHDGRPGINDLMRPTIRGTGSYEVITPKIMEMVSRREGKKDYYIRGTYTGNNTDFSEDVMHFYNLGAKSISIEPVVAESEAEYRLSEEDLPKLRDEYNRLASLSLDNDFNFFHFNIDFDGGPCLYKRLSGCGAGTDYLAITPDGEIFPCHQFVSYPKFKLGTLETGIENRDIMESFASAGLKDKESCKNCWVRYICGGGCHANSFEFNQDLKKPYNLACELERMRVEAALMRYVKNKEK